MTHYAIYNIVCGIYISSRVQRFHFPILIIISIIYQPQSNVFICGFFSELKAWQPASSWVSSISLIPGSFHQAVPVISCDNSAPGLHFRALSYLPPATCFPWPVFHILTSRLNFIWASEGCLLFSPQPHGSSSRRPVPYLKEASLLFCSRPLTVRSDRRLKEHLGVWEVFGRYETDASISWWWCFDSNVRQHWKKEISVVLNWMVSSE